ncbi:MAG: hypothetical protein B7Y86_08615 [Brevundimonas subvibrioides]|uniref:Cell wall polymerase n=1 Tax=Brevundimonas subvibrioides TaxID=74313 RepID=A0A258HII1_9CAUL|nr:hypothetical protein [Brevundimonas subvibrioides]OYX56815.1 MAG: hypothetical protein B7Y86_08615 [Brevundimonas subvibrioides]
MTVAERIIRVICRLLPPGLRDWGEAMAQETASIPKPGAAMAFALSCGVWVVREALGHALLSGLTSAGVDPEDLMSRRTSWKYREAALLCAIAATGLGLVFLAEAGAPAPYLILNLTALIAGLIIILPFRRLDPVTTPFVGVLAIAVGLILLLTGVFGAETSDIRRWLSLGGVVVQPSLIGLPFLLVAFARSRDRLTTAGLILGAVALALQPDRAMAGAMVAGIGVSALMKRDRMALLALSIALACFIVTTVRPDALPPLSFVDGVFRTASSTSLVAGLAVWVGVAVLLLPSILGLRRSRDSAVAHATFGATWLALIAAAFIGDYPIPAIAYGGSAIVGYVCSILALPAEVSLKEHHPAMIVSNSRMTTNDDADRRGHRFEVKAARPGNAC